jgi:hypothetical protein
MILQSLLVRSHSFFPNLRTLTLLSPGNPFHPTDFYMDHFVQNVDCVTAGIIELMYFKTKNVDLTLGGFTQQYVIFH